MADDTEEALEGELTYQCDYAVGKEVGEYEIVPSGLTAKNGNYTIAYIPGTLNVTQAAPELSIENLSALDRVYDAAALEPEVRSDSDGALTVTFMKGNEVIPNAPAAAGSYRVIVNTEATKNYLVGNKEFSFEIRKAPLTVKAKDQTAYVGDKIPALGEDSYTVSGLVGKDTLTGDVTLKYDPETPNMTKNGDAAIKISGTLANDNYDVVYVDGKLTITTRPSSGGGSSSGSSNPTVKSETTTNPDGSVTKTETKKDGTVIETTTEKDGSVTKTETKTDTKPDGTKAETKSETVTNKDGSKVESETRTETKKDGTVTESKTETITSKDGTKSETKSETKTDKNGVTSGTETTKTTTADGSTGTTFTTTENGESKTVAETRVSEKAVETAKKNGEAVTAPVEVKATRDSDTAPTVKVELPKNAGETKVEIPVSNVRPGTVAVLVKADGTEEILKNSIPTEDGIQLTVDGNATVKIIDNSKNFIDTRNHWAEDEIDFVSARGLVNGMSDTIYAPNNSTTRAQLWTILARQADADLTGGATWYEKAQNWAKDKGVSDGANPNAAINRAQMVTMLWRAMGQPAAGSPANFIDVPADAYYANAVSWAVENGITTGVGNGRFDPTATCTRAQIAAFLMRSMK